MSYMGEDGKEEDMEGGKGNKESGRDKYRNVLFITIY